MAKWQGGYQVGSEERCWGTGRVAWKWENIVSTTYLIVQLYYIGMSMVEILVEKYWDIIVSSFKSLFYYINTFLNKLEMLIDT